MKAAKRRMIQLGITVVLILVTVAYAIPALGSRLAHDLAYGRDGQGGNVVGHTLAGMLPWSPGDDSDRDAASQDPVAARDALLTPTVTLTDLDCAAGNVTIKAAVDERSVPADQPHLLHVILTALTPAGTQVGFAERPMAAPAGQIVPITASVSVPSGAKCSTLQTGLWVSRDRPVAPEEQIVRSAPWHRTWRVADRTEASTS